VCHAGACCVGKSVDRLCRCVATLIGLVTDAGACSSPVTISKSLRAASCVAVGKELKAVFSADNNASLLVTRVKKSCSTGAIFEHVVLNAQQFRGRGIKCGTCKAAHSYGRMCEQACLLKMPAQFVNRLNAVKQPTATFLGKYST
jgi:hypothetical protein